MKEINELIEKSEEQLLSIRKMIEEAKEYCIEDKLRVLEVACSSLATVLRILVRRMKVD